MTQKFSIKGFADNSITGEKIAGFTSATDGFVITKSSGSLTWAQAAAANPTMGGDLSGTASNAQIAANAVGVTELNVTAGTAGQALTIDSGGALGFTTIVTDPTMGGDMTGTASNAQIAAGAVTSNELATTGTASSSTFLAGNMAWETVPPSPPEITTPNNFFKNWSDINSSFTTTVSASENAGVVGPISIVTGNTWSIGGGTVKIL
jgi:hypothetical protein